MRDVVAACEGRQQVENPAIAEPYEGMGGRSMFSRQWNQAGIHRALNPSVCSGLCMNITIRNCGSLAAPCRGSIELRGS